MSSPSSSDLIHPTEALFGSNKALPIIPACEHYAGSEKLILKALALQETIGPYFDVTCDCEDGAQAGQETEHAQMVAKVLRSTANKFQMAGVRIHDYHSPFWKADVDILIPAIGDRISYITLPKCSKVAQIEEMIDYVKSVALQYNVGRIIPIHVLIETHGALKDAWEIAALDWVRVLDFGMMDFVSDHHGAIPSSAMRSPGQFDHPLLARAKTEIATAALANAVVPSHNVTLDLKSPKQTNSDATRARNEFGFLRMWSIHPSQIQPIIDAMKPDYSEVEDAANILLAAQDNHWGPIQYKGELYDRASYRYYWQLLQRARLSGLELSSVAQERFFNS